MEELRFDLKAEELAQVLEAKNYELNETPIVVDIVDTGDDTTGDYAVMYVAAQVSFANTSTGKLTKAQLRMKGWTERTMVARAMEVVSKEWLEEAGIKKGDEIEGMKLRILESTEKFYDKQTPRISKDGEIRVTDDEEGDEYYQMAVLVDDDEFEELGGHDLLKTMKLSDWTVKYEGEEASEASNDAGSSQPQANKKVSREAIAS